MTTKNREQPNLIKLSKYLNFVFDKEQLNNIKEEDNFLGWEYSVGKIEMPALKKIFSNNEIIFFPVTKANLQENCIIKNLTKLKETKNIFNNSHILIDWPEEFQPNINQIIKSFPHCITATPELIKSQNSIENLKEQNLIEQIEKNPICFFEPFDTRRHFLHAFYEQNISIQCIGSVESYLQWNLYLQTISENYLPPELLVSGALTTWIQKNLEIEITNILKRNIFLQKNLFDSVKNIIKFIQKHPHQKIIIVCGYELIKTINFILKKQKIEIEKLLSNVISLKNSKSKNNLKQFKIYQTSYETFSEYMNLTGFFAKDLLEEKNYILSWIQFAQKSYAAAFIRTAAKYAEWTKLEINASQERDFFRFSYRLALDRNMLFPCIFDILLAAKAVVDSNFAFELFKECKDIPTNPIYSSSLETLHLPLNQFFNKTAKVSLEKFETIQSQKKFSKTKIQSINKLPLNKNIEPVSEEKYANNSWVHDDHPYSCSFPSEDIFMEKLALNIKKNMQHKIRSQETVFLELQADFCDGLDIRETIRNWHKEKIIIKDCLHTAKADIGTVVFSFADSSKDYEYSWRSFWLAEQHDDSNLMFYATPFKNNLIGPGIAKSEFGGFAVMPLPSAIENPWNNPYIQHHARNFTECLILAGALSTNHKSLLFISNHPPSQRIAKILKQSRKNIIYAKLDEFSQEDIRMVRTFHILAEAGVRNYAQKYIRKDS
ncbi:MAG: hypothetical protein DCC88_07615 [Spirobacillus cienkowskii]|jgi:hypothetical protein|uniref:Uncharacterized protein n=1 Tax=Spirobacillus cienkowskii TaxID=495820 RepID=A0A369KSV4_9BACT|nr:MAG: hypothetical protein DCC88_07615 [Spirobacillus cienkowskii]